MALSALLKRHGNRLSEPTLSEAFKLFTAISLKKTHFNLSLSFHELCRKRLNLRQRLFDLKNHAENGFFPLNIVEKNEGKSKGEKSDINYTKSEETAYQYDKSSYVEADQNGAGSGPNRMLKYWEKNIIPRIKDYVRGSFRDYEVF